MGDVVERKLWDKYMAAYEDMIRHTSRPEAPLARCPADNKWFTRLVVAAEVVEALDRLDLKYPKVTGAARRELETAGRIAKRALIGSAPGFDIGPWSNSIMACLHV